MEPRNKAQARNRALYQEEDMWRHYTLFPHDGWAIWEEIASFADGAQALEIGPGMHPHLPIPGTYFVDLSMTALSALRDQKGHCLRATAPLPFADATFDLVAIFEVLEHVVDDNELLRELARVLRPDGVLFFSVPMNPDYFTYFDKAAGHQRRYREAELLGKLASAGFEVDRVCAREGHMAPWFGTLFALGVRFLPRLTAWMVHRQLPRYAGKLRPWRDGNSLTEAEQSGGVFARARKASMAAD